MLVTVEHFYGYDVRVSWQLDHPPSPWGAHMGHARGYGGRRPKPKTRNKYVSQDRKYNLDPCAFELHEQVRVSVMCKAVPYRVSYYKRCPCTNTGASRFSQAASPLRHAPRHALPLHGVAHPPDPPAPSLSPPQMRNSSAKAAHASCQLPSRLRCIPGQKPKRTERILPGQSRAD